MASAWKARIAGGLPITGSAENTPPPAAPTAEQGDNEHIPTLESLKKFIPADKLWPINDTWFMHAGAWGGNSTLANIRLALKHRYGPSTNVEDFVRKAQLAHYENTRAQFENFAASGWATHKMVGYWMLNSHWPSFYGNLIDYYLSPGGAYYGAKKGLRPLSVVFDYYATGDNSQARIIVFNQTPAMCAACAFAFASTISTARCATTVPRTTSRFHSTARPRS